MKIVASKQSVRRILCWLQRALVVVAVSLLGYSAFVLLDSWSFQKQQSLDLDRLLHDKDGVGATTGTSQSPFPPVRQEPSEVPDGGLIGRIEIPRLQISAIVVQGVDNSSLRRAVGHIPGTALPGRVGNVGIAGHRDTFFRPLEDIQVDDVIVLTTLWGEYRYLVVSSRVVSPDDIAVLDPTSNDVLTLVTCHPFYFVGPAPDRFVVRAERDSW